MTRISSVRRAVLGVGTTSQKSPFFVNCEVLVWVLSSSGNPLFGSLVLSKRFLFLICFGNGQKNAVSDFFFGIRDLHPFRDLKLKFISSRRQEQLSSRCQQRVVATVEESVLRTEMDGLESQEEDVPKRVLFYKPLGWLGQIRSHRRDESWSVSLW